MPRPSSVQKDKTRVYRYQVQRQREESLTLPRIQQQGFTHPHHGFCVMLPREFDVVLAFEPRPHDRTRGSRSSPRGSEGELAGPARAKLQAVKDQLDQGQWATPWRQRQERRRAP